MRYRFHPHEFVKKYMNAYGWLAFATGFALMAYEMVAARLLAPSIGTSTYIWTSVIGIMIAALAAGYAAGGWLADRRTRPTDVAWLVLLAAFAMVITLAFSGPVLDWVVRTFKDPRSQGITAATILFLPASFVLGAISPYLAKLQTKSLESTGRSVAGLSALNSLGGISGTFMVGFVLFSAIGSRETLACIIIGLTLMSWAVGWRPQLRARLLITGLILTLVCWNMAPTARADDVATFDTPTSHYIVRDFVYPTGTMRGLVMGPYGIQSAIDVQNPDKLALSYTNMIATLIAAAPTPQRILILGGGAFSLPEYLARHYPDAQVDVVEIDPDLPAIAQRYFDYQPLPNVRTYLQDARSYIASTDQTYDIVVVDAYSDFWVPFSLTTQEYTKQLSQHVAADGLVMANIIGSTQVSCQQYLSAIHQSYSSALPQSLMFPVHSDNLSDFQNIIAVYSRHSMPWADNLLHRVEPYLIKGPLLTDNFAPIEQYLQRCVTGTD